MNSVEPAAGGGTRRGGRPWLKPVAVIVVVLALFVLARVFDAGQLLEDARAWIDGLGSWGPVAFALVYIGATVLAVPGTPLTVAAGVLFGAFRGVVLVSIASTVGASLCFLVARYVARDAVTEWLRGRPKFEKLDGLALRHGAVMVAVTRLIPLFPFNLLNYGFGLTRVPFWQYVLVSWACMLPGTVLYVVGPSAVAEGLRRGEVPWGLVGVLVLTAVVLYAVIRVARGKLEDAEGPAGTAAGVAEDNDG